MCVCVLARQTTERVCLHHRDQLGPAFKVSISRVNSGPNGHIGNNEDRVLTERLLGHSGSSGWCGATGLFVGGVAEEETVHGRFFLRSASGFSVKFISKLKPV